VLIGKGPTAAVVGGGIGGLATIYDYDVEAEPGLTR